MKARTRKRTHRWLGGAALLTFLSWYLLGLAADTKPRAITGKVTIYGQVEKQGAYTWHQGMTARELISDAGGTTPFAMIKKVKIIDPNTPGHVKLWRKAQGWLTTVVNGANDWVDASWKACRLPGISPHFRMLPPTNIKAIVDLRKPSTDIALSPGDVVIVEEKLINF